jgi:hypothetical protein
MRYFQLCSLRQCFPKEWDKNTLRFQATALSFSLGSPFILPYFKLCSEFSHIKYFWLLWFPLSLLIPFIHLYSFSLYLVTKWHMFLVVTVSLPCLDGTLPREYQRSWFFPFFHFFHCCVHSTWNSAWKLLDIQTIFWIHDWIIRS